MAEWRRSIGPCAGRARARSISAGTSRSTPRASPARKSRSSRGISRCWLEPRGRRPPAPAGAGAARRRDGDGPAGETPAFPQIDDTTWRRLEDAAIILGARMLLWSKAAALEAGRPGAADEWEWWIQRLHH